MSEVRREVDTAQMALEDPWKSISVAAISLREIDDLRRRFRVVKAARHWAQTSDNESTAIFAPSEVEANSMDWDIFRPTEEDGRLNIKRRTKILLPVTKPTFLTDCKSTEQMMKGVAHSMIGWLNMFMQGKLHGDINLSTIFAIDEDEKDVEGIPPKDRYEFWGLEETLLYMKRNPIDESNTEKVKELAAETLEAMHNLEELVKAHDLQRASRTTHNAPSYEEEEEPEEPEDRIEISGEEENVSKDSPGGENIGKGILYAPETWEAIDKLENLMDAYAGRLT